MKKEMLLPIVVVVALVVVGVLLALLLMCKHKDNFCGACQGMDKMVCPDRNLIRKLYREGKLTEYTDFNCHKSPEKKGYGCQ